MLGGDDTSEAAGSFQQRDPQVHGTGAAQLRQPVRRGQTRDAPADDDDVSGH